MWPDTGGEAGSNGQAEENPQVNGGRPHSLVIGQKEQEGARRGVAMKDGTLVQHSKSNGGLVVQHTQSSATVKHCGVKGREGLVRRGCWRLGVEQEVPGQTCFLCGQPATEQASEYWSKTIQTSTKSQVKFVLG